MKQKIREHYLKIRKKKYFELSNKNQIFIAKQVKKLSNKYKINKLAFYYPINYELNILSAILRFQMKKIKTCLPVIEKNNNTINENLCFVPFFKKADLIAIMKSSLLVSILS